ncbi:ABC transporter ATP-binding protein [Luteococcus sp. Sow4_B9]|uniref:ABC transporter ATP-binding protein n=1 Tax=Luteococcus sp. Sow4_B9 TaxID=3438792 RepID=UPI003F94AFA0
MIVADRLTKSYGQQLAVDSVSFAATPGRVCALAGVLGSGRSTILRMVCGLTPPTSGSALVLGRPFQELPNPSRHVGVMLDASAQHPGRTGQEVLQLAALVAGVPRTRIEEVRQAVLLGADDLRRKVRDYTATMRQQLALAAALIGRPSVLVLDEPATQLGAQGRARLDGLLRSVARDGGTVLFTARTVGEVELLADDVVVMSAGRVVAAGSVSELMSDPGSIADSEQRDLLLHTLLTAGIGCRVRPDRTLDVSATPERVGQVARDAGIALTELRRSERSPLDNLLEAPRDGSAGSDLRRVVA